MDNSSTGSNLFYDSYMELRSRCSDDSRQPDEHAADASQQHQQQQQATTLEVRLEASVNQSAFPELGNANPAGTAGHKTPPQLRGYIQSDQSKSVMRNHPPVLLPIQTPLGSARMSPPQKSIDHSSSSIADNQRENEDPLLDLHGRSASTTTDSGTVTPYSPLKFPSSMCRRLGFDRSLRDRQQPLARPVLHFKSPDDCTPKITDPATAFPRLRNPPAIYASRPIQDVGVLMLAEQLKKSISNLDGAQRMLFVGQKKFFESEINKLNEEARLIVAERERLEAEKRVEVERIDELVEWIDHEKKYLESEFTQLDRQRDALAKERADFEEEKCREKALLAQQRAGVRQDKELRITKESQARVDELQAKLKSANETVQKRNETITELRARCTKLERAQREVRDAAKECENHTKQALELRKKIVALQNENAALRKAGGGRTNASLLHTTTRLAAAAAPSAPSTSAGALKKVVRWAPTLTHSRSDSDITAANAARRPYFTMPGAHTRNKFGDLVNTKYEFTTAGNEYTFQSGLSSVVVTELKCHCTAAKCDNGNITWRLHPSSHSVEVNYVAESGLLELISPDGNRILAYPDRHFEIHYHKGSRMIVEPSGRRFYDYVTEDVDENGDIIHVMELYEPEGCIRWSTVDDPTEFEPEEKQVAYCPDGIFRLFIHEGSLSFHADFKARRVDADGYVKIAFTGDKPPIVVTFCPQDAYFNVQHILSTDADGGNKLKRMCYEMGRCVHQLSS